MPSSRRHLRLLQAGRLTCDAIVGIFELLQHRMPLPKLRQQSLSLFPVDAALQHRRNGFRKRLLTTGRHVPD
jgi:hypothetical protein